MRRHASMWAVGVLAACGGSPLNKVIPVAERSELREGDAGLCVDLLKGRMGEEGLVPKWESSRRLRITARMKRMVQ